jgi:hypothetical protein
MSHIFLHTQYSIVRVVETSKGDRSDLNPLKADPVTITIEFDIE